MSPDSIDQIAAGRGAQAEAELVLFNESFAKLKAAALEELVQTSPHQAEKRERLYLVAHISETVRQALVDIALNGKVARIALANRISLRP